MQMRLYERRGGRSLDETGTQLLNLEERILEESKSERNLHMKVEGSQIFTSWKLSHLDHSSFCLW